MVVEKIVLSVATIHMKWLPSKSVRLILGHPVNFT